MAYRRNGKRGGKNGRITKNTRRYRRKTVVPVYDKPELKYIDTEITDEDITVGWDTYNPATVLCLNAVAQGDAQQNRDGRVYYIHSVMLHMELKTELTEAFTAPLKDILVRICLVHDTQTNQAEMNPLSVMDTTLTDDYLNFRNLSYTGRFKVLKDKTCIIRRFYVNEGSINSFASGTQILKFDWFHTFKSPIKVICSGTSGQVAVVTNSSLQIMATSNTATEVNLSYQARCRFSG